MTVLPSDSRSTPAIQAASALRTDSAASGADASERPAAPAAAPPGDRVELSAEARAQPASAPAASDEIEGARVALRAGAALSPARLHELREQVRTGHYDSPEAVDRIAGAALSDLSASRA